jgi:hypothetical protein
MTPMQPPAPTSPKTIPSTASVIPRTQKTVVTGKGSSK